MQNQQIEGSAYDFYCESILNPLSLQLRNEEENKHDLGVVHESWAERHSFQKSITIEWSLFNSPQQGKEHNISATSFFPLSMKYLKWELLLSTPGAMREMTYGSG